MRQGIPSILIEPCYRILSSKINEFKTETGAAEFEIDKPEIDTQNRSKACEILKARLASWLARPASWPLPPHKMIRGAK